MLFAKGLEAFFYGGVCGDAAGDDQVLVAGGRVLGLKAGDGAFDAIRDDFGHCVFECVSEIGDVFAVEIIIFIRRGEFFDAEADGSFEPGETEI